jgi:hypothetical protein
MENTNADRFLFLQDSWKIKDDRFWSLLDELSGSIAITSDPYLFGCYAGVYERKVIDQIGVPIMTDKADSIRHEITWHELYAKAADKVNVLFPELTDSNATEQLELLGRTNLVLENDYIIKYKGTWYQ